MSFQSTWADWEPEHHGTDPLLETGPDGGFKPSESMEYPGTSSRESSPAASVDREHGPSSPRILNLEFGSADLPQPASPRTRAEIDRKILEAYEDLVIKRNDCRDSKAIHRNAVDEVNSLARQYNDEKGKAPIYPPKGTWFHYERKVFPGKMAEHEEKLRFILRLRQAVIDNDLPKALEQLRRATDAVNEAQIKFGPLRHEKEVAESRAVSIGH